MGAELQFAFPTAVATQNRKSMERYAETAVKSAVRFWFAVTLIGQLLFAGTVAFFYGVTGVRGNFHAWNKTMTHGNIAGQPVGNFVVGIHLVSAVLIILCGALQLIPGIRERFPVFHRWTGRLYVVTAFSVSVAGLYMTWIRGTVGNMAQHLAQSFDGILIMLFAVLAMRYAMARDFKTHRRWALRLYMVVSASLFIRAGFVLAGLGINLNTVFTFMTFAQYLVPLGVLELYFHAQERKGTATQFAFAAVLFVLTLGLGTGVAAFTVGGWVPEIKRVFDPRISISDTIQDTIAARGLAAGGEQYHILKSAGGTKYNFEETELDNLGYQYIRANKYKEAILVFQLNIEAYPKSSNTYDDLGEAYMDDGDKALAITNYEKSLELNPKNTNAVKMLQKLNSPDFQSAK